jgi:hypothetical protein
MVRASNVALRAQSRAVRARNTDNNGRAGTGGYRNQRKGVSQRDVS